MNQIKDSQKLFHRWQIRTIVWAMIGYALYYFVRKNFSLAMPGLQAVFGITKVQLGIFLTLNGVIYGLSRFINGFMADRVSSRKMMVFGLTCCSLTNIAFGCSDKVATLINGSSSGVGFTTALVMFMGSMWLINGYLQGFGVPPVHRLMTHWIPAKELATKMSIWNTSHSLGAGLVVVLCGVIMNHFGMEGWRLCFLIPASIALVGAIFVWISLRDTPSSVGLPELTVEGKDKQQVEFKELDAAEYKKFIRKKVFGNRLIWTLALTNFFVYVVRFAVLDWGPTLLHESKGFTLTVAAVMVAIFELVGGNLGMIAAGWATDHWFGSRAHRTCVFCMGGVIIATLIFWQLPAHTPWWLQMIPFAFIGFFLYGPQALLGIAAANQATKRAAASANGLLGIFGYASTLISGIGFGYIAQYYGWGLTYMMMSIVAALGLLVILSMWKAAPDGYATADADKVEEEK
jgi:sugar phosphate permease